MFYLICLLYRYCNSHLQVLGLVPKKNKKVKKLASSLSPGEQDYSPDSSRDDTSHDRHKKAKDKKKKKKKDKDKDRDKHKHAKNKSKSKKHNHISQILNSSPSEPVDINALSLLLHQSSPSAVNHHGTNVETDCKLTKQSQIVDKARTKSKTDKGSLVQDRIQHKLERNKQRMKLQRDKEIEARAMQGRLSSPTSQSPTPMQPSFSGLLSSILHHHSNLYSGYLPVLQQSSSSSTIPGVPHSHAHLGNYPSMPFHLPPPHVPPSATVVLTNTRKPRELYKQKLKIPAVDNLREAFQTEEKRKIDLFPLGK